MTNTEAAIALANECLGSESNRTSDYDNTSASHCKDSMSDVAVDTGIVDLESLKVEPIPYLNGDQLNDALLIKEYSFQNRLIKLDGRLHFFNGRESAPLDASLARKYIGDSMANGAVRVSSARITGTYNILQDQIINRGRSNPPHKKVFFRNGVYNLLTKRLEPHDEANFNTRTLSVSYKQNYDCPKFINWLEDIFEYEPEKIGYLQELIGWTLTRHNLGIEKAMILIGPTRAGKGVLMRLLKRIHGEGATSFVLGNLNDDKQLFSLQSSHLAIETDTADPKNFEVNAVVGRFKVITSNEPTPIRQLYTNDVIDCALNCKLLIGGNDIPLMPDDSSATAHRWLPLIFDKSFQGKEDSELLSRLLKEIDGIANWAMEGLARLMERKRFILPNSSVERIETLISGGGTIGSFINDELVIDRKLSTKDIDLYDRYQGWATKGGYKIQPSSDFKKALAAALQKDGVTRAKSIGTKNGPRGFRGFGLKPTASLSVVNQLKLPETG